MSTQKKASKAGVRRFTASVENIASVVQYHYAALGIPKKAAMDFAVRCDMLSDFLDQRRTAGYFDPSEIGFEVPGPEVYDTNNPFMEGHFTQERFRALDEKQLSGELANNAAKHVADPKLAKVVRDAAYKAAMESFSAMKSAKKADDDAEGESDDDVEESDEESDDESDEGEEESEDAKAEKTAMMAELYNRIRRQARVAPKAAPKKASKKAEDADETEGDEASEEEVAEGDEASEEDEAKKTASLFGLYR